VRSPVAGERASLTATVSPRPSGGSVRLLVDGTTFGGCAAIRDQREDRQGPLPHEIREAEIYQLRVVYSDAVLPS
jgi:hypothetical protein